MSPLTAMSKRLTMAEKIITTYRYRVKDKHAESLSDMADSVNFIWNYCNNAQKHARQWNKPWLTHFELTSLTAGGSQFFKINTDTIGDICKTYANSRRQHKRPYLRYRGKKSLGWIPIRGRHVRFINEKFRFNGTTYSIWMSRTPPCEYKIKDGSSFSQDRQGRWYLNLVMEVDKISTPNDDSIGIDLGLKTFAKMSNGESIDSPKISYKFEKSIARAQRARKKRQVTKIHARVSNKRKDFLHKTSTKLANEYGHIIVGNVSASKLAKTKMAKSVLDAGWSGFRKMLNYKAIARCGTYIEVNETDTTHSCSECGSISGPKGIAGTRIREWQCGDCGSIHDRDHNAAKNILRLGHKTPVVGAAC